MVIGPDVVQANEVVRPGPLHPQEWEGHLRTRPSEGTRVPDDRRCLCRLLGGAEVQVGGPSRVCELSFQLAPLDLGPSESRQAPEER